MESPLGKTEHVKVGSGPLVAVLVVGWAALRCQLESGRGRIRQRALEVAADVAASFESQAPALDSFARGPMA